MSDPAPQVTECSEGGYNNRPGWWIAFAFDESWIAVLKAQIPAHDRTWDATTKRWWVAKEQEGMLRRILPSVTAYLDQMRLPL